MYIQYIYILSRILGKLLLIIGQELNLLAKNNKKNNIEDIQDLKKGNFTYALSIFDILYLFKYLTANFSRVYLCLISYTFFYKSNM